MEKYHAIQQDGNLSITFCCLINRVHFLRDDNLTTASLSRSRAHLCEILAIRVFRENAKSMLHLTMALTTSWHVWSGADPIISQAREEKDEVEDRVGNAIEMAILGKAKKFIKSSSCQKVIDGIWRYVSSLFAKLLFILFHSGRCVYQAQSAHSILSDVFTSSLLLMSQGILTFLSRHTSEHQFIFMILTRHHFLTTIGLFLVIFFSSLLIIIRLKVPSIRSVLDYLK